MWISWKIQWKPASFFPWKLPSLSLSNIWADYIQWSSLENEFLHLNLASTLNKNLVFISRLFCLGLKCAPTISWSTTFEISEVHQPKLEKFDFWWRYFVLFLPGRKQKSTTSLSMVYSLNTKMLLDFGHFWHWLLKIIVPTYIKYILSWKNFFLESPFAKTAITNWIGNFACSNLYKCQFVNGGHGIMHIAHIKKSKEIFCGSQMLVKKLDTNCILLYVSRYKLTKL